MTITVDTDLMRSMAANIASAQLELEHSAAAMSRVVEHEDWCCQERDMINEAIRQLRQKVLQLGEDMELFSDAVRGAADDFSSVEQSIPAMFQEAEVMLGHLGAIPSGSQTVPNRVTAGIAQRAAKDAAAGGRLSAYLAGSLTEDIQICRFGDFAPLG